MAEQSGGGGSRVSLVVDIVSDERAWAMFAAAALQVRSEAKQAAELADQMHEQWRIRFRGEEGEDDETPPAEAPKPAVTAATRKAPNLLDEDD